MWIGFSEQIKTVNENDGFFFFIIHSLILSEIDYEIKISVAFSFDAEVVGTNDVVYTFPTWDAAFGYRLNPNVPPFIWRDLQAQKSNFTTIVEINNDAQPEDTAWHSTTKKTSCIFVNY